MSQVYVELGKIVGVWGVKGWVKLHSYTRNRADIAKYKTWNLASPRTKGRPNTVEVLNCREQGQGIVAQLDNITDRDQAMGLIGQVILVNQDDLPELPKGEFYWQQLIGLIVNNADGKIGRVDSILETGANDVLVVKQTEDGLPEVLIPYTEQAVIEVNIAEGTILVDWDPAYLLE